LTPHTFDVVRALAMAGIGAFCSGCFFWLGYVRGRIAEQKATMKILSSIKDENVSMLEAMRAFRKLQLEGERRGLPAEPRR
jgi:hypothetical protein